MNTKKMSELTLPKTSSRSSATFRAQNNSLITVETLFKKIEIIKGTI
jgi:hypothetical protein